MAAISSGHAKAPNCVTIYDVDNGELDWISIDQNTSRFAFKKKKKTSRFRSWSISIGFKIDWVKWLILAKDFVEKKTSYFWKNYPSQDQVIRIVVTLTKKDHLY